MYKTFCWSMFGFILSLIIHALNTWHDWFQTSRTDYAYSKHKLLSDISPVLLQIMHQTYTNYTHKTYNYNDTFVTGAERLTHTIQHSLICIQLLRTSNRNNSFLHRFYYIRAMLFPPIALNCRTVYME